MKQVSNSRENLFAAQNKALRNPLQIVSGAELNDFGFSSKSLIYKADDSIIQLLQKLKIRLLISREYEHLLIMLGAEKGKLIQTFFPVAHPSGLAIHPSGKNFYVASTRNPNRIIEFSPISSQDADEKSMAGHWIPSRIKIYPGATYLHDLTFIGDSLYANSVGYNGVFKVDFCTPAAEKLEWWPPSTDTNGQPDCSANYLQLNSIAAGNELVSSCFTASTEFPQSYKPGHKRFKVDKQGVVFNGQGDVIARRLTRPHSARFYNNRVWLCNSGYGQVGYVDDGKFTDRLKLSGWTRGLCFHGNYLFAGISRILPGFEHYAPGIDAKLAQCAVVAADTRTGEIVGKIVFPNGNQIFGLEALPSLNTGEFPFTKSSLPEHQLSKLFFSYLSENL